MHIRRFFPVLNAYLRKGAFQFIQYPADQAISAISLIVQKTASFIALLIIVRAAGHIGGWNIYDLAFLYSFFLMIDALNAAFIDGIWNIGNVYIRRGLLDILLTRPVPVFFQLVGYRLEYSALGSFFIGLGLNLWLFRVMEIKITAVILLLYVLFIVCGTVITASVYLVFNSLNFWLVRGNEIADLSQTVQEFSKYPQHIFPRIIQIIMAFVIPFAFTSYYPVSVLAGRLPLQICGILLLVTVMISIAASAVWRFGLKSYKSTGS